MNSLPWLGIALRWLHIVAVIAMVGGMIFMRFALAPSVDGLADEQRQVLQQTLRSRWAKLVAVAIAFLLISGIWNYVRFLNESKTWGDDWRSTYNGLYQAVFGVKFILALVIFFLASALAGRTESTRKFRENAKLWMNVNLALALVVIALSNILRTTHTGPTGSELKQPVANEAIVSR